VGNIATYTANSLSTMGAEYHFTVALSPPPTKTLALTSMQLTPTHTFDGQGSPLISAILNVTASGTGSIPNWQIQMIYYPDVGYGMVPGHVNPPISVSQSVTNGALSMVVDVDGMGTISNIHDGLWHPFVALQWGNFQTDSATYTVESAVVGSNGDLNIIHTTNDTLAPLCTQFATQSTASTTSADAQIQVIATCADPDGGGILVGNQMAYFFKDHTNGYEFTIDASSMSLNTVLQLPQGYPATTVELIGAALTDGFHHVTLYGRCARGYEQSVQAISTLSSINFCSLGTSAASHTVALSAFHQLFLVLVAVSVWYL